MSFNRNPIGMRVSGAPDRSEMPIRAAHIGDRQTNNKGGLTRSHKAAKDGLDIPLIHFLPKIFWPASFLGIQRQHFRVVGPVDRRFCVTIRSRGRPKRQDNSSVQALRSRAISGTDRSTNGRNTDRTADSAAAAEKSKGDGRTSFDWPRYAFISVPRFYSFFRLSSFTLCSLRVLCGTARQGRARLAISR